MEWVPGLSSNVDLKHWRHLEKEEMRGEGGKQSQGEKEKGSKDICSDWK